jgi:replicative DNA helicase
MEFTRIQINTSMEKRILTGMIVSKDFLEKIVKSYHPEYIESSHIRKIIKWIIDYYLVYKDAPRDNIKDIYISNKKKLKDEEFDILGILLEDILTGYTEGAFNDEYFIDQAIAFFKTREITILHNNVKYHIDRGEIEEAEKEITTYITITKPNIEINGFISSDESLTQTFENEEDNCLMKLPRSLGIFMGEFQREWLVGISAPFKKGKTWLLGEFTKVAALSGLKVVSFNLEMSLQNMRKRTYMSLTGASEVTGPTIFPCFDCQSNQNNTCKKDERQNTIRIPNAYSPHSKYKPCTYCKEVNDHESYEMAIWSELIDVPKLEFAFVKERMQALKRIGKANIWLECMPRFSASISDIETKIDHLEYSYNFIPDVLIIDYADILKSDDPDLKGVEKEDEVWMSLARIASKRKMLVVVPTQLNRDSLDAKQIKTSHTAKWVGKLGHVDAMFALNQTPPEKEMGLMRISILEHRHKDFNETDNCYVLQKYSSGQAHLDSYWKEKQFF